MDIKTARQVEANKRWQEKRNEHVRYLRNGKATRTFLKEQATKRDIEEVLEIIKGRKNELYKNRNLEENKIKIIEYPKIIKGNMKIPNYLIHNVDNYSYVVFKEISKKEKYDQNHDELLYHDNKIYSMIVDTPSESKAMLAIERYWESHIQSENK